MANKTNCDEIKKTFEKEIQELKVISIMDLNNQYMVVTCQPKNGKRTIPGISYKINKKTGDVAHYSPIENLEEFEDALNNRCKMYE